MFENACAAEAACSIESGPASALNTYLSSTSEILGTLSSQVGNAQCKDATKSASRLEAARLQIVGSINKTLDASHLETSSWFYFDQILRGEVPTGIFRDQDLITNMGKKIQDATQNAFLHCADGLTVENDVSKNKALSTKWKTIADVYGILLQNNTFISRAYRNATKGETAAPVAGDYPIIAIADLTTFQTGMIAAYGPVGKSACIEKQDSYKKLQERMKNIGNMGSSWKKGLQEWKSALALLKGWQAVNNEKQADNKLKNWTDSQKMAGDKATIVANANAKGTTKNDYDGQNGFLGKIGERVANILKEFETQTAQVWNKMTTANNGAAVNTPEKRESLRKTLLDEETLKKDISKEYTLLKANISEGYQVDDKVILNMMEQHTVLDSANKSMKKGIEKAEALCNAQATGLGNCKY